MRIKQKWEKNLKILRKEEINYLDEILKDYDKFQIGLELGCGDGYQSQFLKKYCRKLYSTDLNEKRLNALDIEESENLIFKKINAEKVAEIFEERSIDFIYSSNLLEHVLNIEEALDGMRKIMHDDGIMIHIVPNSRWRILSLLLFYPNKVINVIERIFNGNKKKTTYENNLSITRSNNLLTKIYPQPHGVSKNAISEIIYFNKFSWIKRFKKGGFKIKKIKKGPISSGYGFGLKVIKKIVYNIGFTTEHIFVLEK